jgi:hypothetical protein
MTSRIRFCAACGATDGGTAGRFCTACGAPTSPDSIAGIPVAPQPRYSNTLINTTRLLSALCMLSGILAVARFDSSTPTGRTLIIPSILIATCGQIFIHQASKDEPPAWTGTALTVFWLGLVGLAILWLTTTP